MRAARVRAPLGDLALVALDTASLLPPPMAAKPGLPQPTSVALRSSCWAGALSPSIPAQKGLPRAVAATRSELARAAVKCDWSALARLVRRNGNAIRYTFGEGNDPIGYWRSLENSHASVRPMRALRLVLSVPFAKQAPTKGLVVYMWPAAFAYEHPTNAQLEQIARTGLYSMATLRSWIRSGVNYLGYRVIITAQGRWTTLVEGD